MRTRRALVTSQVALAAVLAVGAGSAPDRMVVTPGYFEAMYIPVVEEALRVD